MHGDRCEVVLYTPTPRRDASRRSASPGARKVIDLWADRTAALGRTRRRRLRPRVREPRRRGRRDDRPSARADLRLRPRAQPTGTAPAGGWKPIGWPDDATLGERIDRSRRTAGGVGAVRADVPDCDRARPTRTGARPAVDAASDGPRLAGGDAGRRPRAPRPLYDQPLPYMMWLNQRPTDGRDGTTTPGSTSRSCRRGAAPACSASSPPPRSPARSTSIRSYRRKWPSACDPSHEGVVVLPVIGPLRCLGRPDTAPDQPTGHARSARRVREASNSTGRGRSSCSTTPTRYPRRRSPAGAGGHSPSPCPATGRCRTPATCPHYTNVQMPFAGPPPTLPERDPTGVYRTTFDVPRGVDGTRRSCSTSAVPRACTRSYVNGVFAGYGTDSRLPSEYDVIALVRPGENDLAIVVIRYSAAQLHRGPGPVVDGRPAPVGVTSSRGRSSTSPTCVATPTSTPAPATAASTVVTEVAFGARRRSRDGPCAPRLRTPNGTRRRQAVGRRRCRTCSPRRYVFTGHTVEAHVARCRVRAVVGRDAQPLRGHVRAARSRRRRWSRRRPTRSGSAASRCATAQLLVNGQPIWIFGVNRHDHHPDRGKAVNADDMRARPAGDARPQHHRRAHLRTTRTTRVRTTCATSSGMYVIDEANIESHAYNTSSATTRVSRRRGSSAARGWCSATATIRRSSCGASATRAATASNHDALAGWIRRVDPSRPLHYEGA